MNVSVATTAARGPVPSRIPSANEARDSKETAELKALSDELRQILGPEKTIEAC